MRSTRRMLRLWRRIRLSLSNLPSVSALRTYSLNSPLRSLSKYRMPMCRLTFRPLRLTRRLRQSNKPYNQAGLHNLLKWFDRP